MNIYPDKANRVSLQESDSGELGIGFFRTFTSVNISPAVEDHMLTIPVRTEALGELFLALKHEIDKNPKKFGFNTTN